MTHKDLLSISILSALLFIVLGVAVVPSTFFGLPSHMTAVAAGSPFSCAISIDKRLVSPGGSATLSWTSTNADGVLLVTDSSTIGYVGTSGSLTVMPATSTTYYCASYQGSVGYSPWQSATLWVGTVPLSSITCALSLDKTSISPGESTVLRWTSSNADGVYIPGIGYVGASGAQGVSASTTTQYTCQGYVGNVGYGPVQNVTLNVVPVAVATSTSPVYIATAITSTETCNLPFSGAMPSTLPTEANGYPVPTPITYQWNFSTMLLSMEKALFNYSTSFTPGRVSFATNGRPIIRDRNFNLQVLEDNGTWESVNLLDVAKQSLAAQGVTNWQPAAPTLYGDSSVADLATAYYADPSYSAESQVVFDKDCNGYALLMAARSSLGVDVLLHSFDGGHSWAAYPIPGTKSGQLEVAMELPTRQGSLVEPPALLIYPYYPSTGWADTLNLVVPVITANKTLSFSGPYVLAQNTDLALIGGIVNQVASVGDLVHVVYPGTTPTVNPFNGRRGSPEYAATYSRSTGALVSGPTFLGVGTSQADEPVVDPHDQPVIAVDSQNYLHVVVGGHDGALYYLKSTQPNETSSWTPIQQIGIQATTSAPNADEYTYTSLVTDGYNEPIVAARYSGNGYVFKLATFFKNIQTDNWTTQQTLLDPGRVYYANWYQRLSIDPWGRLFMSYLYYPDTLFADEAKVIMHTFGYTLTAAPNADGTPCVATDHMATSTAQYCHYQGYGPLNNGIVMSPGRGKPFQLATTKSFFQF